MKKVKIIIGLLVLYASGKEYISASRQLLTYWSPGILMGCMIMLIIATWLIGSGLSKEKLNIRSTKIIKYFALSILLFVVFAGIGLITYKAEPEMVTVNGVEVNIADIMDGSRRVVPVKAQRKAYCMCVVEKLTSDKEVATTYKSEFKEGRIDEIFKKMSDEGNVNIEIDLSACGTYLISSGTYLLPD
jgi:hypothetical protein